MAPDQVKKAERIATELEKQGVISESSSNFNTPIVRVKKKTERRNTHVLGFAQSQHNYDTSKISITDSKGNV